MRDVAGGSARTFWSSWRSILGRTCPDHPLSLAGLPQLVGTHSAWIVCVTRLFVGLERVGVVLLRDFGALGH